MAAKLAAAKLRLPPLPTIRDIVRIYNLKAMRQLSQNFLMDERLTDKFVRAAGKIAGGHVCEVGPGPGGITRSILRRFPAQFTVVEKDERFQSSLDILKEAASPHVDFRIIIGDILKTDMENLFPDATKKAWDDDPPNVHLIGNLPFSVSTILVIRWLQAISEHKGAWAYGRTRMTLTFQKEVAERMVAGILKPQRCRLSVMCQNWCKVEHKFTIKGSAFVPRPDVDVGVVTLTPLKQPLIPLDFHMIEKFLRVFFHTKRKYGLTCSKNLFPEDLQETLCKRLFESADLHPRIRPYQVTNEEFKRLIYAYKDIIDEYPMVADYNFRACKKPPEGQAVVDDGSDDEFLNDHAVKAA